MYYHALSKKPSKKKASHQKLLEEFVELSAKLNRIHEMIEGDFPIKLTAITPAEVSLGTTFNREVSTCQFLKLISSTVRHGPLHFVKVKTFICMIFKVMVCMPSCNPSLCSHQSYRRWRIENSTSSRLWSSTNSVKSLFKTPFLNQVFNQ